MEERREATLVVLAYGGLVPGRRAARGNAGRPPRRNVSGDQMS